MKHSLIILSFLLLSPFITSCDKTEETLYRWSKYPDYLWKGFRLLFFGDKETHPTYEGEVKVLSGVLGDSINEGLVSLTFPDGEKYFGEFKDDKPMKGIVYLRNGNIIVKIVNVK